MSFKKNLAGIGNQPDIVLIITDQQRATQHFPPDFEEKHMPNLYFLKKNGFSFDRAFCNTCMCSPSRATLFTGTYPAQHGVTQTLTELGRYSPAEGELDNTTDNLMNMLHGEGYDVQYRGKWHLSKGKTTYDSLTAADVNLYGGMGWLPPDSGEDANPLNFGGGFANHDARYLEEALSYLKHVKERRAKGDMQPYCLILSIVNPHDVLGYPKTAQQYGYNPSCWAGREVPVPLSAHENLQDNNKPPVQFQTLMIQNAGIGPLPTLEMKLNYINFYAYLLEYTDKQISRVIDELYSKNVDGTRLADKALVIQTSDHGEMGLSHGGLRQKMFMAYEEMLRVPMVISNPVVFPGEVAQSSDALASLVDLMPTIAEIANVQSVPAGLRGVSLVPVIESGTPVQKSILFAFDDTKAGVNNKPSMVQATNRLRTIRTDLFKYTYYFDAMGSYMPEYELYDLVKDPHEMHNKAYDPEYAIIRADLERQLRELELEKLVVNA